MGKMKGKQRQDKFYHLAKKFYRVRCRAPLHDGSPNVGGAWAQEATARSSLVHNRLPPRRLVLPPPCRCSPPPQR
uniref:Uncharacterized protein n=1 Tax=Oryza glaberrima TaxID=4538 RepID=I1QW75_ORYGL